MGTPLVRPPQIRDREDQFQRETREAIIALDTLGARKVTVPGVTLPAGVTVQVPHQVGKAPIGWQVIDRDAAATVFRDPARQVTREHIPLQATATVTVTLQFW